MTAKIKIKNDNYLNNLFLAELISDRRIDADTSIEGQFMVSKFANKGDEVCIDFSAVIVPDINFGSEYTIDYIPFVTNKNNKLPITLVVTKIIHFNEMGYEENLYYPDSMRTYSGIYINIKKPDYNQINIEDIAHALSNIPRFGGHLPIFYSVAEHCINVCKHATKEKFECLLHDASEAYLMDMPTPVKKLIPNYYELEDNLMRVISERLEFKYPISDYVKELDKEILKYEWQNIFIDNNKIETSRKVAKDMFLDLFNKLRPH